RDHRARGYLERLDEERAQQEHDQDHREETDRILDPPRFFCRFLPSCSKDEFVQEPHEARDREQQEQEQGKAHFSPVWRTARKASCGISTAPTCFMRFLPSFCFSSSLRLRVTSPP